MRSNIDSKNVWQQMVWRKKIGEQILLDENFESKMGNKFFLKQIFLRGNFGAHFLEEQSLLGRKFCQQNGFGVFFFFFFFFFARKISFGGRKEYWVAKMFWRGKIWGAKNFESRFSSLMVSPYVGKSADYFI